jgi:hypothetical protein
MASNESKARVLQTEPFLAVVGCICGKVRLLGKTCYKERRFFNE